MRDADDAVVLTEREREALAGLADSIGDPWLARQLNGQEPPPAARRWRLPFRSKELGPAAGWLTGLLVLGGAALVITTFVASTLVATLGLVMMALGLRRLADQHSEAISRRLATWRAADPGPSAPRTPPGAA